MSDTPQSGMNRQRRAAPIVSTKAAGHTGVMLALFVPASALPRVTALQDGLPNPEPAEDLHLTLAYLGNSDALIEQRPYLERMLGDLDWVAAGLPLSGTIGGIGRFHHDEGNGTNAVYASVDAPGLPMFRQRLVDMLKNAGIMPAENHGFTPHITLAYVPTDQDISTLPSEPVELVFGTLTLAWRDERIEFGPGARMKEATVGVTATTDGASSSARPMTLRLAARMKQKALTVFKDASGRWRWISRTTTAYRDRDGEIVSTKAIADDVAWSDTHGQYGPLRWWHVGKPNPRYKEWGPEAWGSGLDIGDCDLRAVSGNCLMESGTFRDERTGTAIAAKADEYGISPGFFHSAMEPDGDGVFASIKTFERSLVPLWRGTPANLFTRLMVQEVQTMDVTKRKAWEEAGVPKEIIERFIQDNQTAEKSAQAAGVAFKDAETPPAAAPVEATPAATAAPEQVFFGDMTIEQAQAWMQAQQKPVLDALAGLSQSTATKAAQETETAVALKAAQTQLSGTVTRIGGLEQQLATAKSEVATLIGTVKELTGEVPAGIRRASQDPSTVIDDEHALKSAKPGPDDTKAADGSMFGDFWNSFATPGQTGQGG